MTNEEYGKLYFLAYELVETSNYNKAEEICNELIKINSKQAPVYNLLSIIKSEKGDLQSSIKYSHIAIELNPNDFNYYLNLGSTLRKNGYFKESLQAFENSLQINPNCQISLFEMSSLNHLLRQDEKAIELLENLLSLNPNHYQANVNLGFLYLEKNYYNKTIEYCLKALSIFPQDSFNLLNLSIALFSIKSFEQAKLYLESLIINFPYNETVYNLLSRTLIQLCEYDEAKKIYAKTIELSHSSKKITKKLRLEIMNRLIYENKDEIYRYRDNIYKVLNSTNLINDTELVQDIYNDNLNITVHCAFDGKPNKDIKSKLANLFLPYFPEFDLNFKNSKINIVFLVTINNELLFLKYMKNIINNLDDKTYNIFLACYEAGCNHLKDNLKENITFTFITSNLINSSKIIYNLKPDVIYYWEIGTDALNYFLPFYRLAKVQCTSIGWPDTTGIKNVDYFISSQLIETENAQENYSEKLIMFEQLPLYYNKPILEKVEGLDFFNLSMKDNIYICCQSIRKLHPDFDYILKNILEKDNKSIIVFFTQSIYMFNKFKNRLKKKISKELIEKIIVFPQLQTSYYLSLIKHAKVALDTLYFGGATTSYDCFAINTPIVTLPWTHERGRYTLGCYKQMGIEGLVANSFDEYVELAVKTANDKEFRNNLVQQIKENSHKLFDDTSLFETYNNLFKELVEKN